MTKEHQTELREPLIDERSVQSDSSAPEFDDDVFRREVRRRVLSKLFALARPAHAYRLCKRVGYALTPQLLRTRIWNDVAPKSKQFPTSYLNGLRGITAVKVFTFHYLMAFTLSTFQPWGTNERFYYVLELPIIRYFYAGFTSHIFFGVAGYLTSLRLFQLLDVGDAVSHSKVLLNVSGSLFRRAFRLYLPVFLITLITTTYIYFGLYETNRPYLLDHETLFPGDWNEPKPIQFPTYGEQLRFWRHEMFDLTNICTEDTVYPWHDQHLWSILSEMRASLHLYGILVATAQCRRHVRLVVMSIMTGMYFMWNHWEVWVYILGGMVAQIDIILTDRHKAQQETLPSEKNPSGVAAFGQTFLSSRVPATIFRHIKSSLRCLTFLLAFYFLSYPIDGSRDYAPGYMTLNRIIPEWMTRKDKFYPNFGTAILLLLLARSDPPTSRWRRLLNNPIPQYLGKISFALYLVHGPILHAIGYMIPHKIWWTMGVQGVDTGDLTWALVVSIGWAISLAMSLWAADVWTREVEGRCVRGVKRLEEMCFVKR